MGRETRRGRSSGWHAARTGLFVERGAGIFAFPHLTFQEYLTACDIEKRCTPGGAEGPVG